MLASLVPGCGAASLDRLRRWPSVSVLWMLAASASSILRRCGSRAASPHGPLCGSFFSVFTQRVLRSHPHTTPNNWGGVGVRGKGGLVPLSPALARPQAAQARSAVGCCFFCFFLCCIAGRSRPSPTVRDALDRGRSQVQLWAAGSAGALSRGSGQVVALAET